MEQIKRANRLYTSDTIFLKPTLLIPVPAQPGGPCPKDEDKDEKEEDKDVPVPPGDIPVAPIPSRHDLSATDFLRQLDAEIGRDVTPRGDRDPRTPPAPAGVYRRGHRDFGGMGRDTMSPPCLLQGTFPAAGTPIP
uniref:LysM and peptidoglycan-binding domain-containing protein 1 n=1 Tax=Buteo japonicus TaxID=224669 RepID=A0A8C0HL46_9AVES